jgi:hypothetical protein
MIFGLFRYITRLDYRIATIHTQKPGESYYIFLKLPKILGKYDTQWTFLVRRKIRKLPTVFRALLRLGRGR